MPCTAKKTFASAARTGNALLVRLKGNQPGLHEAVAGLSAGQDPVDRHETADRGRHGRQEHRRVEVFAVADQLPPEWRGTIACAARVSRLSWCKDTRAGLWLPRREVAYHVSQVRLDAATFGRAVRAHWGIENRDHHVRDRTLREDDSRIRRKPQCRSFYTAGSFTRGLTDGVAVAFLGTDLAGSSLRLRERRSPGDLQSSCSIAPRSFRFSAQALVCLIPSRRPSSTEVIPSAAVAISRIARNQRVSGSLVLAKIVPAVDDAWCRHEVHWSFDRVLSRVPWRPPQTGQAKPRASAAPPPPSGTAPRCRRPPGTPPRPTRAPATPACPSSPVSRSV